MWVSEGQVVVHEAPIYQAAAYPLMGTVSKESFHLLRVKFTFEEFSATGKDFLSGVCS